VRHGSPAALLQPLVKANRTAAHEGMRRLGHFQIATLGEGRGSLGRGIPWPDEVACFRTYAVLRSNLVMRVPIH
jgi:hypothetical protein